MPRVNELAEFAVRASLDDLSREARDQLKMRILDSLGCAFGALEGEPVQMLRAQLDDFGGRERCTLIGGGRTAPDRAALYNGALVRYLDFNDSYLATGETGHPSDNFGAVLAAAEYAAMDGRDLLAALAVAYQVQCRLSDEAPVRAKGFDHTVQGSYSIAAGVSRALGLDAEKAAHALAISGTAFNALRVTRTGALSHWKGLAFPNTAFGGTHSAFLAMRGVTGPAEIFEGNKGFCDSIAGEFVVDWRNEDLERVRRTIIKKFNAEIHSQSAVEGALELKEAHGFDPKEIREIRIDIFDVAFHIIGGGEEGDKTRVRTKEEADHSLNYLVAVALLDGRLLPEQYLPQRIEANDVQSLLKKITVREDQDYSARFPDEMCARIVITLDDGETFEKEKTEYEGFHTRPASWETIEGKFSALAGARVDDGQRREIVDAVKGLEQVKAGEMASLLARVKA